MAIYKRYNTRKKRVPWGVIIWALAILAVFVATAVFGHYLGKKADGVDALYHGATGAVESDGGIAPIVERSLCAEYVEPNDVASYTAIEADAWISTWIYRDGKATFETEFDKKYGFSEKGMPTLDSFDISANTTGIFEVSSVYSDEADKAVIKEYEMRLLDEFAKSGLDEVVLLFNEVNGDNLSEVLDYALEVDFAYKVCVPYSMLGDSVFFAEAAEKGIALALMANGVTGEQLAKDVETYGFYFTKYNLRLLLAGDDKELAEILKANVLPNYQFFSLANEGKKK